MAEAPGHRLGQIIGDVLEASILPVLRAIADRHGLYLDTKGPRGCRSGRKVKWTDDLGNAHDLDFVMERGGTDDEVGVPAVFIESAWRRYTKHSRAKAQEIQGALLPLLAKYADVKPFPGAVVAGTWTAGALQQMRSSGFAVVHVDYAEIVATFAAFDIDIDADESTPDDYLAEQVAIFDATSNEERVRLAGTLLVSSSDDYAAFESALERHLNRSVQQVVVLTLYGDRLVFADIASAIRGVSNFAPSSSTEFVRFEVRLTYSNGDNIVASFAERQDTVDFLSSFA